MYTCTRSHRLARAHTHILNTHKRTHAQTNTSTCTHTSTHACKETHTTYTCCAHAYTEYLYQFMFIQIYAYIHMDSYSKKII
mmetsp:Transcript_1852/g.2538  ORF Transcript_1852/g.2538 Transcript_1852/m.2538 type:complete len:82 (-) Transcript_1852:28-273(-)